MHFSHQRERAVAAVAAILCLGLAACGGDDDDDSADPATTASQATTTAPATTEAPSTTAAAPETTAAPESTAAPETTAAPATTAVATGDVEAFCGSEIELEAAIAAEDPDAIQAGFAAISQSAPDEVKPSVETAVAEAQTFMAAGEDPSPEFTAAYSEVMEFVKNNCGFTDVSVTGTEYAFAGIPSELTAGPAVLTFRNEGDEIHELVILKIKDGVTESIDELLALPQKRAERKIDPSVSGGTFAVPGQTGYTAVDFTPGRYVAICFIPMGMTMDVMHEAETGGTVPEGPPHFTGGMVTEFEVA